MLIVLAIVAAIAAAPLAISVVLALRSQWMHVAAVAVGTAVPLQLLGLSSECTQGADGTFFTGAIFSAPFLLSALFAVFWARHKRAASIRAGIATAAISTAMLALTRKAWLNTLLYGTPCGENYADQGSTPILVDIVLFGYLVLPLLVIGYAIWVTMKAGKAFGSRP